MSRSVSPVIPYTAEDKQQLLIDTIQSGNMKLLRFLLNINKKECEDAEAPTLSIEELGILETPGIKILAMHEKSLLMEFEVMLANELLAFVSKIEAQVTTRGYNPTQLGDDISQFLRKVGEESKAITLAQKSMDLRDQLPRLKEGELDENGQKPADLTELLPHLVNGVVNNCTHDQIMDYYDQKFTTLLKENHRVCFSILHLVDLPLSNYPIREHAEAYKREKEQARANLDADFEALNAQKGLAMNRSLRITKELDGHDRMYIFMLKEETIVPSHFKANQLLIQKKKNPESTEYDLVGYWCDSTGQLTQKSLPLADFDGIALPKPGGDALPDQKLFRPITSKFGCTQFDDFNYFGKNIPERLRATPDEQRVSLTWFGMSIDFYEAKTRDTPAHSAAKTGNFNAFQLLVTHDNGLLSTKQNAAGALPINTQDDQGDTLLHRAIRHQHFDQIAWLMRNGADTGIINRAGENDVCGVVNPDTNETLAHLAAKAGDCSAFIALTDYNNGFLKDKRTKDNVLPINMQDDKGDTLLHRAVRKGDAIEIEALLKQGADATLVNAKGLRALDQLIEPAGITLLEHALRNDDFSSFKKYLEKGIDPLLENAQGQTIFELFFVAGRHWGKDKALIVNFLHAFVLALGKTTAVELWPSHIKSIQRYIRQEHEELINPYALYNLFEHYLSNTKNFVLRYIQEELIPRINGGWFGPKPAIRTKAEHKRFQLRWEDADRVLKAVRRSVKESSPKVLQDKLREIEATFRHEKERRGPLGGSQFWEFLREIEERYKRALEKVDFEGKRDKVMEIQARQQELELKTHKKIEHLENTIKILEKRLDVSEQARMVAEQKAEEERERSREERERSRGESEHNRKVQEELQQKLDKSEKLQEEAEKEAKKEREKSRKEREYNRKVQEKMQEKLDKSEEAQGKMQEKLDKSEQAQGKIQEKLDKSEEQITDLAGMVRLLLAERGLTVTTQVRGLEASEVANHSSELNLSSQAGSRNQSRATSPTSNVAHNPQGIFGSRVSPTGVVPDSALPDTVAFNFESL